MALRRIIIVNKNNLISSGFDSAVLVPGSTLDRDPSSFLEISRATCVLLWSHWQSPTHHYATSETLSFFWVHGCSLGEGLLLLLVRVVSAVYD